MDSTQVLLTIAVIVATFTAIALLVDFALCRVRDSAITNAALATRGQPDQVRLAAADKVIRRYREHRVLSGSICVLAVYVLSGVVVALWLLHFVTNI